MTVTCTCGHEASFDAFTSRPVSGDLPPGHYQCPACSRAWTVEGREGEARRLPNGFLVIPPSRIVPVSPIL